MALINKAKREINAKIVYYGREGCGKSLSLRYMYDRLKPSLRGEFKTMQSMGDSLEFLDFAPFEMPMFGGYRIRFHVYTLAGTVSNPAAWKMTLKGADGIVLVTSAEPENLTDEQNSLARLRDFVGGYGISLHDLPLVVQVGRGGEPRHLVAEDLCMALGISGTPACLAQPATGEGVLETLSQLSQLVMARIGQDAALLEPVVSCEQPEMSEPESVVESAAPASTPEVSVALGGEPQQGMDDSLKVPLLITVAGECRRLMLTVSLSEE